jgi:two-component system chemotaxis response regulator CheB
MFADCMLKHVHQFSRVKVRAQPLASGTPPPAKSAAVIAPAPQNQQATQIYHLIALGASVGGPTALFNFVGHFPTNYPLPILVVQHLAPGLLPALTTWLSESTGRVVEIAKDGETVVGRSILFAPDGYHMIVTPDLRIHLTEDPPIADKRPSIDVLFQSIANSLGPKAIGVLLAVVGSDGRGGLSMLKQAGAPTFAQDESSSVIVGLSSGESGPGGGGADKVLPPGQIAREILKITAAPLPAGYRHPIG